MNTSAHQHEPVICNTTPIRYFALVGQFDLLVNIFGGRVLVPRQVLDLEEDPEGAAATSLLSEIGRSERYWAARSGNPEGMERWNRLRRVRQRSDVEIVDLDDDELIVYAKVTTAEFARSLGLAGPLGEGEAAVIAIAETRGWAAALDESAARRVIDHRSPELQVLTSRDLLRQAVIAHSLLDSPEAQIVYEDMLADGYRGPEHLWE